LLERLLRTITATGAFKPSELARQLGVTEGLLDTMLDDLVRMGYLQSVQADCTDCGTCPESQGCCVRSSNRVWLLTEDGQRLTR
jgi:hypothetical protein